MIEFKTKSAEETQNIGDKLAQCLGPGSVVAFIGDLAAGKTTMIQGMMSALGVNRSAESPTYTLVNEYDGKLPVYHMDCYRESQIDGWVEIGINEYFYGDGVCLVEWADRIEPLLPDDAVVIRLDHVPHVQDTRSIQISGPANLEDSLKKKLSLC